MRTRPDTGLRVLCILSFAAFAMGDVRASGRGGGGGMTTLSGTAKVDPTCQSAVDEIKAGRYPDAVTLMATYIARSDANANDADAQNWLGYAHRKSGDFDAAFLHHDKALAINPRHRGAHEYMGEAYLMVGNLVQAEEHLKILDGLCWLPCTEYTQLKNAVADDRVAHADAAGQQVGSNR